jgi:hypothetical protein
VRIGATTRGQVAGPSDGVAPVRLCDACGEGAVETSWCNSRTRKGRGAAVGFTAPIGLTQ